ncbi:MAG: hypothetical protein U1E87_07265 [Alphaproteobacteria bacterium]
MAHPPTTISSDTGHMDPAPNRRDWQTFLKIAKWSSLGVLAGTFFLIFVLIGHAPWLPTLLILALALFGLGALFH